MVIRIQNDDFKNIQDSSAALVDFSATWCGPCRMIAPIVERLSDEMKDKLTFFNVDVDDNPELAGSFDVQSIPTLLLVKDGQVVSRHVGFMPEPQLRSWIDSNI